MHLHNSSISNSEESAATASSVDPLLMHHLRIRSLGQTAFGFLSTLVALDIAINLFFPYPSDPLNTSPGSLNLYFDYGRSIEGKITRQLGDSDETSAPIARAGWMESDLGVGEPVQAEQGDDFLVAVYGMSFSNDVAESMEKLDPKITPRTLAGPAAPPNHSYALYQRDRGQHQANVVMLGILASSVKGMDAMSGMTWGAEVPAPYTFPRYELHNSQLVEVEPKLQSLRALRMAQQQPEWQDYVQQLQTHDRFFNSLLFEKNWLDSSAIFRLIRRGLAKIHQERISHQIHTDQGFNPDWEQIPVLQALVKDFATTAKQDGKLPVVLLLNNRGYDDHLYRLLQLTLVDNDIPYISTHEIAPATDQANFVKNGHFTEEANERIAKQVLTVIRENSDLGSASPD